MKPQLSNSPGSGLGYEALDLTCGPKAQEAAGFWPNPCEQFGGKEEGGRSPTNPGIWRHYPKDPPSPLVPKARLKTASLSAEAA